MVRQGRVRDCHFETVGAGNGWHSGNGTGGGIQPHARRQTARFQRELIGCTPSADRQDRVISLVGGALGERPRKIQTIVSAALFCCALGDEAARGGDQQADQQQQARSDAGSTMEKFCAAGRAMERGTLQHGHREPRILKFGGTVSVRVLSVECSGGYQRRTDAERACEVQRTGTCQVGHRAERGIRNVTMAEKRIPLVTRTRLLPVVVEDARLRRIP